MRDAYSCRGLRVALLALPTLLGCWTGTTVNLLVRMAWLGHLVQHRGATTLLHGVAAQRTREHRPSASQIWGHGSACE